MKDELRFDPLLDFLHIRRGLPQGKKIPGLTLYFK